MTPLTNFDKHAHAQQLKLFEIKKKNIKAKYIAGDITLKKKAAQLQAVYDEEIKYTRESGIISYFGKLFKVDK